MDEYKVKTLKSILEGMQNDKYYLCRVKGDDTHAINLDEGAVKLLIEYYEHKS